MAQYSGAVRTFLFLIAFVCYLFICTCASGLRFYIVAGKSQCFTEDLPSNSRVAGELQVTAGKGGADISLQIKTLDGRSVYERRGTEHGKFAFQTLPLSKTYHSGIDDDDFDSEFMVEDETYQVCLIYSGLSRDSGRSDTTRALYINIENTFIDVRDEVEILAKKHTDELELKLRHMHAALSDLISDFTALQQRERNLVTTVTAASRYTVALATLSILFIILISNFQLHYFRNYFTQKKIC